MQQHNFDVDIHISSSNQKVKINKDIIQVNQNTISCEDVTAIKYGVSLIGSSKKPIRKDYIIDIKSKDGKTLEIRFQSSKVEQLLEEDHTYYYIMSGVWQYVKKQLISNYIEILNEEESFEIGNTIINNLGFTMTYKTWFWGKTKQELVPWNDLKYYLKEGVLCVDSIGDKRKKAKFSLHNDWNAVVLNTLLHYLWQDHRKEKLAKGEKI